MRYIIKINLTFLPFYVATKIENYISDSHRISVDSTAQQDTPCSEGSRECLQEPIITRLHCSKRKLESKRL